MRLQRSAGRNSSALQEVLDDMVISTELRPPSRLILVFVREPEGNVCMTTPRTAEALRNEQGM